MDQHKPDSPPDFGAKALTVNFGKIDYSKAQNLRIYANHVAASSTLFDVRLILSDVDVVGDGVVALQSLTVLMSPELATLVYSILGTTLESYTKAHGKTRLPRTLTTAKIEPVTEPTD